MMENQEIRPALNEINIVGVVKEQKLSQGKSKKDGGTYINGSLVVKAGEDSEITVKVFVSEKTSNGKVKKTYTNLEKILKGEEKTMAEVPEEEAVKVRLWGNESFSPQFKEDIFKANGTNEIVTNVNVDLGFGNLTIDGTITPKDYKATFDVEMFVESVNDELNEDEEETGNVIVKGWVPIYGGSVIPLEVKAENSEDTPGLADDFRSEINSEDTMDFWGDINYKTIIQKIKKGGQLGRAKIDEKRIHVHDLVAVGADFLDEEDEYSIEDIKQARTERQSKIEEIKNKEDSVKSDRGVGSRNGRNRHVKRHRASDPVDDVISEDTLPF